MPLKRVEWRRGEDWEHYHGFERRSVKEKMEEAFKELEEQLERQKVYRHMVNRLLREQSLLQQKVKMMEGHLERKSREVEAKQTKSRRINEDKEGVKYYTLLYYIKLYCIVLYYIIYYYTMLYRKKEIERGVLSGRWSRFSSWKAWSRRG